MKIKSLQSAINSRTLLICMLALPLCFSACKKDSNDNVNTSVSAEEAGTVMAEAVDPETGGLVLQTEASANLALAVNNSIFCGLRKDTTVSGAFNGTNRSFSYSFSLSRMLTCTGSVPSRYDHSFTGSASYSVPAMSSNGTVTGAFALTGLESGSNLLNLDQTYTYNATHQSKVGQQRTFTSSVTIQSSAVKVSKTTRQIVSGSAVVSISGSASTGEEFTYNGTLTFTGNRQATLLVSGGSTFFIEW